MGGEGDLGEDINNEKVKKDVKAIKRGKQEWEKMRY